jgi:serine/threonine protein kinase
MSADLQRTCPSCGNEFPGAMEFCPVCMLRGALPGTAVSGESTFEEAVKPAPDQPPKRFDHYELVTGEDGKPVELGRGAMGVTYKAFDINLHCPVTLKVISDRYLGDESARLRFIREARAAASVRHPNVASVFHLGTAGQNYFYAMEFVEGETLEKLIKRSGRLEVKLALEIATQAAAGLAAVHKQKLVHRDIKPSNIMVSLEEGGTVTTKIIDLGLAKPATDAPADPAISLPGAFAGTPEFASPEQFAGIGVDIRSDLYSLGVVLWEMVSGHAVFRGSPAEVMYQHQHAPLPLDLLEDVPEPVVVLLEALLEKDPARRFLNPTELLKAIPTITRAIDARQRITRQSLQKTPSAESRVGSRKRPARLAPEKISIARLPVTGSDVFGRDEDIAFLDRAWANQDVNVVTIVDWAGVGKSTLVNHWLRRMAADHYRSAELVFAWSFYRQGSSEGISWIEDGIRDYRATGSTLIVPYWLTLKAEALHLADRTPEALEAIKEAEALGARSEDCHWCADLHRLRGVFLAAIGADEAQSEASFCEAIRIAKEQKSIALATRAEGIYAEYRRQKASTSGGRGFRLPLG